MVTRRKGAADKKCAACHAAAGALQQLSTAHEPLRKGRCQWCHKAYGTANTNILHAGGGRALCVICHKAAGPVEGERESHRFPAGGECGACHAPHGSKGKGMLRDVEHSPFQGNACSNCHTPAVNGKAGLSDQPPALCTTCHDSTPGKAPVHEPAKKGQYLSCHTPHDSTNPKPLAPPASAGNATRKRPSTVEAGARSRNTTST